MITEQTAIIPPTFVEELTAFFEKETGRKPTNAELRLSCFAVELGRRMAEGGYRHKQLGREPLLFSAFDDAVRSVFAATSYADIRLENTIAQGLYDNYMIGYTGEKEAA